MGNIPQWLVMIVLQWLEKLVTPAAIEAAKKYAVCWLKAQVANTDNEIDDKVVEIVAKALGIDPASCPV